MLLLLNSAWATSFSATSPDTAFDFLIPLDGSELEVTTTISVPDIQAAIGDPSLDVDNATLTLEFY